VTVFQTTVGRTFIGQMVTFLKLKILFTGVYKSITLWYRNNRYLSVQRARTVPVVLHFLWNI
jgi:hypothetical protein